MRALAIFALTACLAPAQRIVSSEAFARMLPESPAGELRCHVEHVPPSLDFAFRLHAGYIVEVPLNQYRDAGHRWTLGVRLAPESSDRPVFLIEQFALPAAPPHGMNASIGGGYLLGEGTYRASLLLADDLGRQCRAEWTINAHLGRSERGVKLAQPPGTVREVFVRRASAVSDAGVKPLRRLTVLLDAGPVSERGVRAAASLELDVLSALLARVPAQSVRLVVFSLDRQQEIYRSDNFTPDRIREIRQVIFGMQFATVDVGVLQNRSGHLDLLTGLVRGELDAPSPADAVVFLGPRTRFIDKPAKVFGTPEPGWPKFFYVEYQRFRLRASPPLTTGLTPNSDSSRPGGQGGVISPEIPPPLPPVAPSLGGGPLRDTIDRLVAQLNGKTMIVRTPADFAKAIRRITAETAPK